jgi:hypothetical protein
MTTYLAKERLFVRWAAAYDEDEIVATAGRLVQEGPNWEVKKTSSGTWTANFGPEVSRSELRRVCSPRNGRPRRSFQTSATLPCSFNQDRPHSCAGSLRNVTLEPDQ